MLQEIDRMFDELVEHLNPSGFSAEVRGSVHGAI
jgi:hypothetical protein